MPSVKPPKYRKHSSRDTGFVEWRGKRYYLPGGYNSAASREAYRRFLREHALVDKPPRVQGRLTVADVSRAFLMHAREYYPTGSRSEYSNCLAASKPLLARYAGLYADEFGPLSLKQIQQDLAAAGRARTYINGITNRIKRMFFWAVSEELLGGAIAERLRTVPALRKGRSPAREPDDIKPVSWEDVQAVASEVGPTVRAMLMVQWFTGCRSQSVCLAQSSQFDTAQIPWLWRPRHKTEHLDKELVIPIGPQCQAILSDWLSHGSSEYLFSPKAARRNKRYTAHYNSGSYAQAITRAIDRINTARAKQKLPAMPHWSPHQVRHARATLIRAKYGLEAAQASLGHDSIDATLLYAERHLDIARRIAADMG